MSTALKFGRRPGVVPVGLRDLTYYAAGPLPKAPASVAVPDVPAQSDGTPWGVAGNSDYGDCGVAGAFHGFMAAAALTRRTESFPTADEVVDYYLTYTGGQDDGVVLSQFLAYVRKNGFFGHTLASYAPVSVSDVNTLRFAIDAYDFAYVGITVYDGMVRAVQQSSGNWTWSLDDVTGGVAGGHCIVLVGYDSNWLYGISWGKIVRIAYPAWHVMASEAWGLLTGEIKAAGTDGHGIAYPALDADLSRLAA